MSKKTETIEIRVSPEMKEQLNRLSEGRNLSKSSLIRNLIAHEAAMANRNRRTQEILARSQTWKTGGLAAAILLGLGVSMNMLTVNTSFANGDMVALFEAADIDGDGQITRAELDAALAGPMATTYAGEFQVPEACLNDSSFMADSTSQTYDQTDVPPVTDSELFFSSIDVDANGTLSMEEMGKMFQGDQEASFVLMDANNDGVILLDEFSEKSVGQIVPKDTTKACSNALKQSMHASLQSEFSGFDKNGDGKLSEAEFNSF